MGATAWRMGLGGRPLAIIRASPSVISLLQTAFRVTVSDQILAVIKVTG
jgi:hypothetical protein